MDWLNTLREIEDSLLAQFDCDIWERGLYYYLLRRTHVEGAAEQTIPLSEISAALRCSDFQSRKTIRSLAQKGCIELQQTRAGQRVRVFLPNELELSDCVCDEQPVDIEDINFYVERRYVEALINRESGQCFYCLREITIESCELDHVISQMRGDGHGYRNNVASCHECNTKKQGMDPIDHLRRLFRNGLLSQCEFAERRQDLKDLQDGKLIPPI